MDRWVERAMKGGWREEGRDNIYFTFAMPIHDKKEFQVSQTLP